MSTRQITIRVDEGLLDFIDDLVASGVRTSRADAINRALTREKRHARAVQDLEIIKAQGGDPYPDLHGLAEWSAHQPVID
jgi:Arc/MetJ-type ribon-helix-helix transcriptional regulator